MWEGQSVTCFSHGESLAVKRKLAKWKCRHHVVVRVDSGTSFIGVGLLTGMLLSTDLFREALVWKGQRFILFYRRKTA